MGRIGAAADHDRGAGMSVPGEIGRAAGVTLPD